MTIRIAINGFGRIGRCILRAVYENDRQHEIKVVAINDMADLNTNIHLTRHDSTHGKFPGEITADGADMIVNGDRIKVYADRDPTQLHWRELDVDIVMESTGMFTSKEKSMMHLNAGAKKVLISAPGGKDVDATIVYGVNDHILRSNFTVVSNASCTTNCLAPLAKPLHEKIGIVSGLMTTVHSYTNDQMLLDSKHPDLRRARSAAYSMIPTKTGAASALGLVLPELAGKLDGYAMRVPTANVSAVDLTFQAARQTSIDEVNQILRHAAEHELKNILNYSVEPLVSIDFNHNPASATYDATETKVIGNLVKVLAWYDNEWGFSNRMLDTALAMMHAK